VKRKQTGAIKNEKERSLGTLLIPREAEHQETRLKWVQKETLKEILNSRKSSVGSHKHTWKKNMHSPRPEKSL